MGKERKKHGTTRQEVYNFIVGFVTEICAGTGLKSTSSVHSHLLGLESEGKIEIKQGYSPRAIKLVGYKFVKMEGSA